jgi:putative hydrolase of the HAD superfamily
MTALIPRPARKAVLIDLGGVLVSDCLPAAAAAWSTRLGITPQAFLGALFGGSDDQVLTGQMSEPAWWDIVAGRLGAGPGLLAGLRQDLASREVWDEALAALLRRLHGHARTAIVSNAWPGMRARMTEAGMLDITDEIVLSCEAGYAKPDARIYQTALRRLAAAPGDALFIDDTPGHVTTAQSLGMTGHLHTSTAGTITRIEDFLRATGEKHSKPVDNKPIFPRTVDNQLPGLRARADRRSRCRFRREPNGRRVLGRPRRTRGLRSTPGRR